MITKYECEVCGKVFYNPEFCLQHEQNHYRDLTREQVAILDAKSKDCFPCRYCRNCYFVYGIEENCSLKNEKECDSFCNWRYLEVSEKYYDYFDKLRGIKNGDA